ncbi:MSMEG_0570 family nitrogen starvation response protein [Nakamurella sp. YIM 132087]|uniref:MSMEG_0570 family nitrogen starvation response protein n=1 Tax=Nakamurella alba TaxID=2665158 RepID=A0A7K1FJQ4_9ACTN|nr:MSMEG_0570 family nitrogen starvation response protein [Nakamurella alba]MTD14365.1 MSMEG_0570 family nitrogen starvation response protein [Nakamurella alba]
MPEMTMRVRWPDGTLQDCYSPSLVLHDHLTPGTTYPVGDFVDRAGRALHEASERVRAKYGVACTSAMGTLADIHEHAAGHADAAGVEVLTMLPPLPAAVQGGGAR